MKKPKKTLKELGRLEKLLSKQTERSAKLLVRRKTGDNANAVTAGYYERIAAQHATALADLSEIVHLSETLNRQIAEADADKASKKASAAKRASIAKEAAGADKGRKPTVAKSARTSALKSSAVTSPSKKTEAAKAPSAKAETAPVKNGKAPAARRGVAKPDLPGV